jgi:hypothetical protein
LPPYDVPNWIDEIEFSGQANGSARPRKASNTDGTDVFPETQSEIEHLKAQIALSELIVAASEKMQA